MKTNPIYQFTDTTSNEIDKVPVGVLVLIEDSDGNNTPKLVRKTSQGALTSTSTIADFLADINAYKEILGASTIINGGIY